jgi:subtilase family serine protease
LVKNFTLLPKILLLLAGMLALHPTQLRAQTYLLPVSGTASYTTCSGVLYDDGGPSGSYDSGARGSVTLLPGTTGSKIKLDFTLFNLDSTSTSVTIYDGLDSRAPLLGRFYYGRPTVYATNSAGALTVELWSYGLPKPGFAATISCVTGALPTPDLAVQHLELSPTRVPAGEYVSATAHIANLVGGLANYSVRYLLSTDTTPDASDTELKQSGGSLAAGTWIAEQRELQLPAGTAPGNYYILCVAELPWHPEVSTTNNLAYSALNVRAPSAMPDLTITSLTYNLPGALGPGSVLNTLACQQNLSNTLAQQSTMGYYLSADTTLSADDQLLEKAVVPTPSNGKKSFTYNNVMLPPTTAPGTYYILCVADYLDQVIESDEHNNAFALKLVVGPPAPDIAFDRYHIITPEQLGAGGNVTVRCTLVNPGNVPIDSATVGYYLSADRVLGPDDVLLGHKATGPLTPGYSYYGSFLDTLAIPTATAPGQYYLLLVADYRHQVAENDETDNIAALALEIVVPSVDLATTAVRNGSVYSPTVGSTFFARCTLANLGTTTAYPATIGYYYSTDNLLSVDDKLLGEYQATPLAGGATQVIDKTVVLPTAAAVGRGYLLFVADHLHQVAEPDESNNVTALTLELERPSIDLSLPSGFDVLPARTSAGSDVKTTYSLLHSGNSLISAVALGFYLSLDNVLSPDDVFIGSQQIYADYPAYSVGFTTALSILPTTAPGRYYLLGVADYLNEFVETDETNNVRATPLEVTAARPDLTVLANPFPYLEPRLALAGGQVTTESYINNFGAGASAASAVGYYLSIDPVLSANDILLGSTPTEALRAGGSTLVAGSFTVPAATPTGRYYVLFVADHSQLTDDLNRNNNIGTNTLSVTGSALATREQLGGYELAVWPVPAAGATPLRVQLSGADAHAEASLALYNSLGQVARTQTLALMPGRSNQTELPTAGLAAGVYVLRITGPSLNATRRVVIE